MKRPNFLVTFVDPILFVPASSRRFILQLDAQYTKYVGRLHFIAWPLICTLAAIINDPGKRDPSAWHRYRFVQVIGLVLLGLLAKLFKESTRATRLSLVGISLWMAASYSWAMRLGEPVPEKWITYFPLIILVTTFRSALLVGACLLGIVAGTSPLWHPYTKTAWVFTDVEIGIVLAMFGALVWREVLTNRANGFLNENLRREMDLQRDIFVKQLCTFLSPAIASQVLERIKSRTSPVIHLDDILKRRQALVSVLYSDFRDFSSRADKIDFVERELVPSNASIIDRCENNNGVAKQIGDAIIVYYAGSDQSENVTRSLRDAAMGCLQEFERISKLGRKKPERHFIVTAGMAIVGNMASNAHREPTIIGYPANIASRLDSLTKEAVLHSKISAFPHILLSQGAASHVRLTMPSASLDDINLVDLGIGLRSFPEEKMLHLFKLTDEHLAMLNELLLLNRLPSLELSEAKVLQLRKAA